jgi:hypothetical protein
MEGQINKDELAHLVFPFGNSHQKKVAVSLFLGTAVNMWVNMCVSHVMQKLKICPTHKCLSGTRNDHMQVLHILSFV